MLLDFGFDYVLENDRVRLEPLRIDHLSALKNISREENIWTYFLGRSNGQENFESYILDAIDCRKKEKEYSFAVFDKEKNSYAGSTRFFEISDELNTIRLGYTWYGKGFRGTGLNKNCKYLLFEFAFERLKAERIGLGAHEENIVSIAAMKTIGCTEEGRIRNLFPSIDNHGRSDAILLGILKKEWHEEVKHKLKTTLIKI
ncbi:GNAT family N-acetyltransferase [Croceitalea rosinachiae]|uniref:GNAT family protein n=1 Tax=Croceitalea rosinachiae TaxID=3075596 RepID=A0ABU3A8N4_9FLAO|nr:GNAT family protein [Croceitalea sp. F388]MDT0605458.1 GNAT family protein [Croceitalea sp. F388]